MRYKLLLSLREDFLPELEGWRRSLPSLGRVRVRLLPMRPDQALAAVSRSAPQLMDEHIARRIVAFVTAAQASAGAPPAAGSAAGEDGETPAGEVEPALLSLFCRGLNESRKQAGKIEVRRPASRRCRAKHHLRLLRLLCRRPARVGEPLHRERADHGEGFPQQLREGRRGSVLPHAGATRRADQPALAPAAGSLRRGVHRAYA